MALKSSLVSHVNDTLVLLQQTSILGSSDPPESQLLAPRFVVLVCTVTDEPCQWPENDHKVIQQIQWAHQILCLHNNLDRFFAGTTYVSSNLLSIMKTRDTFKPAVYHYLDAHPNLEAFPPTPAYQGQAPVSRKRKSPPPTLSLEMTVILETKAAPSGSQGHIQAADFEGISKAILDNAIKEFSTLITTHHAFPEKLLSDDCEKWTAECWVLACKSAIFKWSLTMMPQHWYVIW